MIATIRCFNLLNRLYEASYIDSDDRNSQPKSKVKVYIDFDDRNPNQRSKCSNLWSNILLKNLLPFFPTLVPRTPGGRRDLVSGLHFNSLRRENMADKAGEISLSFMFLQATTPRLSISFQERTTDSRQSVVTNEHPSRETNFTLL